MHIPKATVVAIIPAFPLFSCLHLGFPWYHQIIVSAAVTYTTAPIWLAV